MFKIVVLLFVLCTLVSCAEWSYSGKNGPGNWSVHYGKCSGMAQSPIEIPSAESTRYDGNLKPFLLRGFNDSKTTLQFINNGHSAQLNILDVDNKVRVEGGGLPLTHYSAQLHFHWGENSNRGAEHIYNNIAYPLEMHIVNFNSKYDNVSYAIDKPDGLAVLGFWFKISSTDNANFASLLNHLNRIQYGDSTYVVTDVILMNLVPKQLSRYFRYIGSLTTPPCFESVTWTLFEEPIEISENQMRLFRNLYEKEQSASGNHKIVDNFRPTLSLNSRQIRRSFSIDTDSASLRSSSLAFISFIYFLHTLLR